MSIKKLLLTIVLSLLVSAPFLVSSPIDTSYHTFEDLHTFSTMYPRTENSHNEELAFDYIRSILNRNNIEYNQIGLGGVENFHSFSSIIETHFSGTSDKDLYFVFPVNHPIETPKDESGAAGLSLALQLCKSLSKMNLPVNVHVLFMGAEYGRSEEYQLGTRAFLENYYLESPSQVIYITLPSNKVQLDLRTSGTDIVAPAWLVEHAAESLIHNSVNFNFSTIRFNLHQMGLNEDSTRIDPYLQAGLPALHLRGVPSSAGIDIQTLHNYLLNFVHTFPSEVPSQWDKHYLFFKYKNFTLLIQEFSYIIIVLLLFASVLLYPFFRRKRFYRYLRSIGHNGWVLPIIFALMFLYLLFATLLLEGIAVYRQSSLMWQQVPSLFLLLKIAFAGFLFALSHRITIPFHFTRFRGSFYSASGLFFLLINVLILTTYNLSLTLYGAAIFILGFLFTIVRHRLTKLIYLLISILFITVILFYMFRTGSSRAIYGILLSRYQGNLLVSFHLLPYMLFILRLRVLYHHPKQSLTKRMTLASDLLFGTISAVLLTYFLFFYSISPGSRQMIQVNEQIDSTLRTHSLLFESSEPLDSFTYGQVLFAPESDVKVNSEDRSVKKELPYKDSVISISIDTQEFLGRTTYTLTIITPFPPEKLDVKLSSVETITLYDSDFPVSPLRDPHTLLFHIGRFPGIPFSFSFTVPEKLEGTLETVAHFYSVPYHTQIDQSRFEVDYHLQAVSSVSLPISIDSTSSLK